jgi:hypothetical protein
VRIDEEVPSWEHPRVELSAGELAPSEHVVKRHAYVIPYSEREDRDVQRLAGLDLKLWMGFGRYAPIRMQPTATAVA